MSVTKQLRSDLVLAHGAAATNAADTSTTAAAADTAATAKQQPEISGDGGDGFLAALDAASFVPLTEEGASTRNAGSPEEQFVREQWSQLKVGWTIEPGGAAAAAAAHTPPRSTSGVVGQKRGMAAGLAEGEVPAGMKGNTADERVGMDNDYCRAPYV